MSKLKGFGIGLVAMTVIGVSSYRVARAAPMGPPEAEPLGACFDQPNMASALSSLRAAKDSLEKAEHNKAGWRAGALKAVKDAISETERGCAMAK